MIELFSSRKFHTSKRYKAGQVVAGTLVLLYDSTYVVDSPVQGRLEGRTPMLALGNTKFLTPKGVATIGAYARIVLP